MKKVYSVNKTRFASPTFFNCFQIVDCLLLRNGTLWTLAGPLLPFAFILYNDKTTRVWFRREQKHKHGWWSLAQETSETAGQGGFQAKDHHEFVIKNKHKLQNQRPTKFYCNTCNCNHHINSTDGEHCWEVLCYLQDKNWEIHTNICLK
jgi:hypothetical protein